jgi:hypothetical protein
MALDAIGALRNVCEGHAVVDRPVAIRSDLDRSSIRLRWTRAKAAPDNRPSRTLSGANCRSTTIAYLTEDSPRSGERPAPGPGFGRDRCGRAHSPTCVLAVARCTGVYSTIDEIDARARSTRLGRLSEAHDRGAIVLGSAKELVIARRSHACSAPSGTKAGRFGSPFPARQRTIRAISASASRFSVGR